MRRLSFKTAEAMMEGKFIALHAYIGNKEMSQVNNLSAYLKKAEKEQNKPQASSRKGGEKVRAEINGTENRKTVVKTNEIKS